MSSGNSLKIDLQSSAPVIMHDVRSISALATASVTSGKGMKNIPAGVGVREHEAGKVLSALVDLDLLEISQSHMTSSVPIRVDSTVDLLGDEVEPRSVVSSAPEGALRAEALAQFLHAQTMDTVHKKVVCNVLHDSKQLQQQADDSLIHLPESEQQPAPPASQPPTTDAFKAAQADEVSLSLATNTSVLEDKLMFRARGDGGDSQSLPSDTDPGRQSVDEAPSPEGTEAPSGQGSDCEDRLVDSDREVVEEEDAFGDFADFTSASHFLPGGVGGSGFGASALGASPPPPSASARVAAAAAGPTSISSPSAHRHPHLGGFGRNMHGMLGSNASTGVHHGAAGSGTGGVSGAVSEHGSLAGDYSDFSHQSPPPSVAPSRGGGGRKSVASIASVGSRAGGDDDLGDYNSVVGSSVWRAPSQMATSSYAAAAGADDDFGDFTSDITSNSDFAPSTQPPSAVAVSGPGSVHPDDDFGSFASHRSLVDEDEDDFGNFNAAPAVATAAVAAGAGPSESGATTPGAVTTAAAADATMGGLAVGPAGPATPSAAAAFSPRDTASVGSPGSGPHPYHSTQSVGRLPSGSAASPETAAATPEAGLLQLPLVELRQAVARALQPLLPTTAPSTLSPLPEDPIVCAAWAQLRRHVQSTLEEACWAGSAAVVAHTGAPLQYPLGAAAGRGTVPVEPSSAQQESVGAGRSGFASAVKFTRPLRWKGSDSERRFLSGLGLSEVAAQARALEATECARPAGRGRLDAFAGSGGSAHLVGLLASFGDAPRRVQADTASLSKDSECDGGCPIAYGNGA